MWCRGTESNCRHQPFQGCALPTELPRHSVDDDCGGHHTKVTPNTSTPFVSHHVQSGKGYEEDRARGTDVSMARGLDRSSVKLMSVYHELLAIRDAHFVENACQMVPDRTV